MISDIQHMARMLIKVRSGDQITEPEANRLREIADLGYSSEPLPPPIPEGMTAENVASATRVGPAQLQPGADVGRNQV